MKLHPGAELNLVACTVDREAGFDYHSGAAIFIHSGNLQALNHAKTVTEQIMAPLLSPVVVLFGGEIVSR